MTSLIFIDTLSDVTHIGLVCRRKAPGGKTHYFKTM